MCLNEVAARMRLGEAAQFSTGDIAGVTRGGVLVLLHILWGSPNSVEKIGVYANSVDDTKGDIIFEELAHSFEGAHDGADESPG